MKKRGLVIGLLIMLAVITSGFTYAFWAAGVESPTAGVENGVVNIGSGNTVTTSVSLTDLGDTAGKLVPEDMAVVADGEVESVTLTFTVNWNVLDATGSSLENSITNGTLTVTPVVVVKDENGNDVTATVDSYIQLAPTYNSLIVLGGSNVVSYVVTMGEPTSIAHYELLQSGTIEIQFTFAIVASAPVED